MNFNMTIELSKKDIKQAIADYVSKQLPDTLTVDPNTITLNIVAVEDFRGESMGHDLKDAKVPVKKLGSYMDR